MEKRKDIDMLRFYGGDIHQKNKEGEYVITNNLVNPKNKEDMLWGDRDAYRTLNALLFEGIENEKERIYKEKRKLNPVFIELIENTLEIYRGIFAVMCRKKGNQLSVSKIKRVDRKASLMAYLKGYTESFVSCTKGEYDDEFAAKNNIILLEIESLENIPYVDYQQVVTMQEYRNYDEKEVLFPPFLSLKVSEIELTTKDNHIKDMYGKPPVGKYQLKMEEFPDYRNAITSSREELLNKILDEKDKAVLCLEHMNNNMWKEDYHECNSKIIKVTFGASRTLSSGVTETPLKLNSSLCFEFDSTEDYAFIYHLWVIAKRFIQYLCYRKNVFFSKVELSTSYKGYKHIKSGELYVLEDLEEHNSEEEVLKKGCYIRQSYITGAVGSILQSIAEDSIYLRHLPQNYEEGHHIDAARFVMITAAFEWEFRRIFPEGIKKKEKKIKAEETVVQLLTPLIENNTGEIKSILKYLKKCVGNDPLSSKLTFVGMELGNIIDIFGKHLYALNGKKLKYSEMGERLAAQRNNFAHGNLDKDFDELALLDLIYLELILYAMQLKFYGVEDVKIKKAINDLFHKNIRIDE